MSEAKLKRQIGKALERAFPDAKVKKRGGTTVITVDGDKVAAAAAQAKKGHNSMADATDDRLRLLVERIERMEEEKKGLADDIRDVYAEAKAVGYDAKVIRLMVRLRKMKPDDRAEFQTIAATYAAALGLQYELAL